MTSDRHLCTAGTRWLRKERGYQIHNWALESESGFLEEVSNSLLWEQQFGRSLWDGNLDALNDGASSWPLENVEHVLIAVQNAERLIKWFGKGTHHIWDILQEAARMQLLFGVGLLVVACTSSKEEAARWAKALGVAELTRNTFPGAQLAKDAEPI